jgi:hypothetical protein
MASGYSRNQHADMTRRCTAVALTILLLATLRIQAAGGLASIRPDDLKEWLTYIASDELQGRVVFSEGLGLAAGYIRDHLQSWGVKPAGDRGGYLQTVRVLGVKATSRSSVTVRVGTQSRTFKDGEGIRFPRNSGAKQALTIDRVEFVGYGLDAPAVQSQDFAGRDVRGAAVVFIGPAGPRGVDAATHRRLLANRSRHAIDQLRAGAAIGPSQQTSGGGQQRANRPESEPDFTTAGRLDRTVPPAITATDAFFEFLFSQAPTRYDALRKKAESREELTPFRLEGVSLTFDVDVDYQVVRTQLTHNVVGLVEGGDAQLKSSYVTFGAHYDHVGYAQAETTSDGRRPQAPGVISPGAAADRIWNGADDDGSGTVALMALARAFAEGRRPKRSLLFVWHAGEEAGLYGSRYFVEYPTVPLEKMVAQLNVDMIGRNRNDQASESNTLYLVGSDRISSELHEISREANRALSPSLVLNYEMNDPADLEQVYYRSDHYSYAAKGIPIIFFTTGLHSDYHANTDEVDKIQFPKLARVAQLIYETGWRLANLDHAPARDNLGPRAGKGSR